MNDDDEYVPAQKVVENGTIESNIKERNNIMFGLFEPRRKTNILKKHPNKLLQFAHYKLTEWVKFRSVWKSKSTNDRIFLVKKFFKNIFRKSTQDKPFDSVNEVKVDYNVL